ncbi:MAG TPA: hypothetical protein VJT50_00890 [Pyrinomonadaceae bacterium]|nr:hypothetical protein [Pyrinomonadaceae bacterium]
MKKTALFFLLFLFAASVCPAQTNTGTSTRPAQRPATSFDLSRYGVTFDIEPRLIVMMAALEAAGFDPEPNEPSPFRAQVRKDLSTLDPDLRSRLKTFYERNKLPAPATPADQSARYVSLALALGPPPALDAPERSEQLPGSLLEVLDFAPLVHDFYRRAAMDEKLAAYTRAYQAEGDRLRQPTADMVQEILSYLHTQPITTSAERVAVKPSGNKKNDQPAYRTREHERHFYIVPDLLAAPGAINFRIIADDYYAVVPAGVDPRSSELRRAYLQFVIDPLILRFNRQIAEHREQIRQVLDARGKAGGSVSADVFLTVSRSLVAAADARFEEQRRLEIATLEARAKLANAKDEATRKAILQVNQETLRSIQDETIERLSDDYERGAVLDFFFAEQLKGVENSGFDIANFFADMMTAFDPAHEDKRLADAAEARARAVAARKARQAVNTTVEVPVYSEAEAARAAALVKQLAAIEQILQQKDYVGAEARLKDLMKDYSREPRIFFALGQTASVAAADATDEDVQARRLQTALANYRLAIEAASPDSDKALMSRAHVAMGRIYAFLDKTAEAAREFDEAIRIGEVTGGAYREALQSRGRMP